MLPQISSFAEYQKEYQFSVDDPEGFWAEKASQFTWRKKWDTVLEWNFKEPRIQWFQGGKLNITENCLDRHLAERGDKIAILWEANDPQEPSRTLTYRELHREVCRFANVLRNNGVEKGDRVCIYMPMIPEAAIAILACVRLGAIHSVVFGGFSALSLSGRIQDAECELVVTSDGAHRGSKNVGLKTIVDEAVQSAPSVERVIVFQRTGDAVVMQPGRDVWWHDEIAKVSDQCEPEIMDAEDPLFILYTSGSTGKPKGVVHTIAGYMVFVGYTYAQVFQPRQEDVYWCSADVGWVTGHSYLVYGPLLNGVTTLMFEGIPTHPDAGRFWEVIDKHRVTIFYTAPTAIRSLMAQGPHFLEGKKLDSLRVLGSVGEPINEEAWRWYHDNIGKKRCPIVDTWWQTETGGVLISPLAGVTPERPSYATLPLPGIQPVLVDANGQILTAPEAEGNLCIKFPWPSMLRTIYRNHEHCRNTYFTTYPGLYHTGDGCKRDKDGYLRITGRSDDVIKISGHRLGTAEIEAAINQTPSITESAVVGYPHDIKGQGIYAYVICPTCTDPARVQQEVIATVSRIIGPIAKPDKIQVVRDLPKTRSGKIMRRILRKIAEGDTENLGDTSTLLDPTVVDEIRKGAL